MNTNGVSIYGYKRFQMSLSRMTRVDATTMVTILNYLYFKIILLHADAARRIITRVPV